MAFAFSQSYIPIDTNITANKKSFIENLKSRHELDIDLVKNQFSGQMKKQIQKSYGDQFESLVKDVNKGEIYFDDTNQQYIESLILEIKKYNSELNSLPLSVNFSRAHSANAFSVGEGTIVVHLDLLNTLENEAELISVICHEIAHYKLNHRNKSVEKFVAKLTSDESKKEEREIKSLKYNKQKRAENFIKDMVYSRTSKSRIHEMQADSLGFEFFKRTNYNPKYIVNSLQLLEKSDNEKDSLVKADYEKFFTTKNQKFIDQWLDVEDFSGYKYSKEHSFKWNVDSLKTHPDCAARIAVIAGKKYNEKADYNVNAVFFNKLKTQAKYENIYNFYFFKEYGYSLYEALKYLKIKKTDTFLTNIIYKNLVLLSKAKKEMKFNNFIPRIDPTEHSHSQQLFFNFMNNLSVKELETITNDYR